MVTAYVVGYGTEEIIVPADHRPLIPGNISAMPTLDPRLLIRLETLTSNFSQLGIILPKPTYEFPPHEIMPNPTFAGAPGEDAQLYIDDTLSEEEEVEEGQGGLPSALATLCNQMEAEEAEAAENEEEEDGEDG